MASDSLQIPGYEILRPLGSGGMSTVHLALQRSLDRKVAIKVMRRLEANDAGQIEKRFLLEGRMLAKLPHRNIVAVYDIVSNDHLAFITMEYLGGGVLSDKMRAGLSLADAVAVIVQIASALEFAHQRGVVHRDLKPANIMFRDSGTPVLTDFGIARYQDSTAMRLTQTGMLVGTPTYMSPEQINGVAVDGRADQYSLGILFHELLTGAPPFRADTSIAVLMAHLSQPLQPLPYEFRAFEDVIARMLAKNRDDRYPDLKTFSDDLKSRLVSSDTLLMRLQVDPSQPSSEQLRALGFLNSTPGASPRAPTPMPFRTDGAKPSPTPPRASVAIPTSGAAPASPAEAARKRSLLLIAAGVAVVLLLLIGGWLMFGNRGGAISSDERDQLVALWLERAERRIESDQLLNARDANDSSAFAYLQKVLQKDPGNQKAQTLIDRIAVQLAAQTDKAIAPENLAGALAFVNEGLQMRPKDAVLINLKARIEAAQKNAPAALTHGSADNVASPGATPGPAIPATPPAVGTNSAATNGSGSASGVVAPAVQPASVANPAATTSADADAKAAAVAKTEGAAATPAVAERGELIVNAQPWATVDSIIDDEKHPVKLPADTTTPFMLPLPVGKYTITFRNPLMAKPLQATTTIEANKRVLANVFFPTTSVQGYFSRAGW